jgi:Xaa-Pro aminopeptidase
VTDSRPARLAAVRRALGAQHLDALLITAMPNVRYLTGFTGSSALVVVTHSDVVLITDFRYQTQVADEVAGAARIVIEAHAVWARLWSVLPEVHGVERIGFESAHLRHRDFQRLIENGARWQWRPTLDLVEAFRQSKDADELRHIRLAAEIAGHALGQTLPRLRPGMSELAIAGLLEHALRDAGSEGYPFETIAASGPRSALPHARASARLAGQQEFLLIDFGAVHGGYCCDMTRTVVLGTATDHQREAYEVVRAAQAHAISRLRVGMTGRDADATARSYIERAGWGEAFGHSLGHGIGLEVHEAPRLARTADAPLPLGAVVTVEPGVYRPGWGGVRIEDDVYLGEAGPEVLTTYPRELLELA